MVQPIWRGEMPLPVGWYVLEDGRRFYGMGAADLREFCAKGWNHQAKADQRLAALLVASRGIPEAPAPVGPVVRQSSLFDVQEGAF